MQTRPGLVVAAAALLLAAAVPAAASTIIVGEIRGVISGATVDYVKSLIDYARSQGADLVVIRLDTPGGSLESALEIIDELRSSPVPVAGYVDGRWAMSAGTMILMCTDIAAMRPASIIGAVQPVRISPEGAYTPVNETKILNPVYKQIEVCMKLHGRNASIAKLFVYRNLVLDAEEALHVHAIDFVADSVDELVEKANGTFLERLGYRLLLREPVEVVEYPVPPGLRIAQLLSDPVVGSILSSIAFLVIIAGLASGHPHMVVLGVGLLLLSLYGIGVSASLVSAALVVIGLILLIIELAVIPGFGVVGFTGILLLVVGFLTLFTGKPVYMSPEALKAAMSIVVATVAPLTVLTAIIVYKAMQAWRLKPVYQPSPVGKRGRALDDIPPGGEGFVMVEGEYWRAVNVSNKPVRKGDTVIVKEKREGGVLEVEPVGYEKKFK